MPRDRVVQLRADSADVAAWQARADAAGLSLSEYTRRALDSYEPVWLSDSPRGWVAESPGGGKVRVLEFSNDEDYRVAAEILER